MGIAFFGFDSGSAACLPSRFATQSLATGQSLQRGFRRTHSVAPRSMMAWVYSATRSFGVCDSDSAQRVAATRVLPGQPCTPAWRASTRLTLPSKMAWRSPQLSERMAPAVERPMPGNASSASRSRGRSSLCCSQMRIAAADIFQRVGAVVLICDFDGVDDLRQSGIGHRLSIGFDGCH